MFSAIGSPSMSARSAMREGALAPEARESAVAAFRALFFAAAAAQLLSLALLSRIEERPLRGRTPPPVDE